MAKKPKEPKEEKHHLLHRHLIKHFPEHVSRAVMLKEMEKPYRSPKVTLGQKWADRLTTFCGSWTFIFLFFVFIAIWMGINVLVLLFHWDPYPFILLNLILSCLAAIQAPIILMSQNREVQRDRIRAERDFYINRKAEREVANMQKDLDELKYMIKNLDLEIFTNRRKE